MAKTAAKTKSLTTAGRWIMTLEGYRAFFLNLFASPFVTSRGAEKKLQTRKSRFPTSAYSSTITIEHALKSSRSSKLFSGVKNLAMLPSGKDSNSDGIPSSRSNFLKPAPTASCGVRNRPLATNRAIRVSSSLSRTSIISACWHSAEASTTPIFEPQFCNCSY
jgi:hypothetical protein